MYKKSVAAMLLVISVLLNQVFTFGGQVDNVPAISQFPKLPTGCESVALTMLLNWGGIAVDKEEVAKAIPWGSLPNTPHDMFIGNPYSKRGLGVYVEPVINTIKEYNNGKVINLTGSDISNVLEYIDHNIPVMVWCTINMKEPVYVNKWIDTNGKLFAFPRYEHAVVIVGHDDNKIYVNDPGKGRKIAYDKWLFTQRYNDLGKQAVTLNYPTLQILDQEAENPVRLFSGQQSMIPAREYCSLSGYSLQWLDEKSIRITMGEQEAASFSIGESAALIRNQETVQVLPAKVFQDVLYIDINIAKALDNLTIQYDRGNLKMSIDGAEQEQPVEILPVKEKPTDYGKAYYIMVNGQELTVKGYAHKGTVMIPIEDVCSQLGFNTELSIPTTKINDKQYIEADFFAKELNCEIKILKDTLWVNSKAEEITE